MRCMAQDAGWPGGLFYSPPVSVKVSCVFAILKCCSQMFANFSFVITAHKVVLVTFCAQLKWHVAPPTSKASTHTHLLAMILKGLKKLSQNNFYWQMVLRAGLK